jgi:hypothetical protein
MKNEQRLNPKESPVLVYVRPWNRDQFMDLAKGVWPDVPLVEISEHPSVDVGGLKDRLYRAYSRVTEATPSLYLDDTEVADVVLRCRLLRMIDPLKARRLVIACEAAIDEMMDRFAPRAMLSITTDSYILHLFVLACRRRGIPFIGLVPTFVNGHFRVTALGEYVPLREVDEAQVDDVAGELLDNDYKPDFLVKSSEEQSKKARRLWVRNLVKPYWFGVRRRISGDPLNYHYWSTEVVARQKWALRMERYDGETPADRRDLPTGLRDRPLVYLPLQMSPEATIDYWSRDSRWISYEDRILELLDEHSQDRTFLIKEHPNIVGYRSPGFYSKVAARKNAVMIAPNVTSNLLLDMCDAVLFNTGTVGFEAALRGVPVYSDSEPFHLPRDVPLPLASLKGPVQNTSATVDRQRDLIRYVLRGTLPGRFINDGSWNAGRIDHVRGQETVIESLKGVVVEAIR